MRTLLIYAADDLTDARLSQYRNAGFIESFCAAGLDPVIVDIPLAATDSDKSPVEERARDEPSSFPRSLPQIEHHIIPPTSNLRWVPLGRDDQLLALCQRYAPDVIQTFGYASCLGPVWSSVSRTGRPIVHTVTAGGPVADRDNLLKASWRIQPSLRSIGGYMARRASKHVSALTASNRSDLADHRLAGFFPAARFSVVTGVSSRRSRETHPSQIAAAWPRFGYFNPEDTDASWAFVRDALSMIRSSDYTLSVAPCTGSDGRAAWAGATVAWLPENNPAAFVETIDVLIVPYSDDHFAEVMACALLAGRMIIASDNGFNAEFLDFGRRGTLFKNGSGFDLADKMRGVIGHWKNRNVLFDSGHEVAALISPDRSAEAFRSTYSRILAMSDSDAAEEARRSSSSR